MVKKGDWGTRGRWGDPNWEKYGIISKKIIDKYGLKPAVMRMEAGGKAAIMLPGHHGGIRLDHIHHDGKIYVLTKQQWNEFSKAALKQISGRLAGAGSVDMDSLASLHGVAYKK